MTQLGDHFSHPSSNHHESYLQACNILSGSEPLKHQRAGEYLSVVPSDFSPKHGMPSISADELTQIALVNKEALSFILLNPYFSEKLDVQHLTQLANHSLKAAFHILYGKNFLKKFKKEAVVNNLKQDRFYFINALAQNRIESYDESDKT